MKRVFIPIIILMLVIPMLIPDSNAISRDCNSNVFHILYINNIINCLNKKINTNERIIMQDMELREKTLREDIDRLNQRLTVVEDRTRS